MPVGGFRRVMRLALVILAVFALGAYIAISHDGVSVLIGLALIVAVPVVALRRR